MVFFTFVLYCCYSESGMIFLTFVLYCHCESGMLFLTLVSYCCYSESGMIFLTLGLLLFVAFGKYQNVQYHLNEALHKSFESFSDVKTLPEWWQWSKQDFQDIVHSPVST